ncbi:hypothetical protein DRY87_26295, partial [Salmonella enterica subsp. enterica serovar Newport]|nr:hypothetical protein [Salmonella enterica subsp. enterica serovar Newport]
RRARSGGFGGQQPISWTDLADFSRATGVVLGHWEKSLIEMLDDLLLSTKPEDDADADEKEGA